MSTLRTPHAAFGDSRSPFSKGIRRLTAWSLMSASALLSRFAERLLLPSTRMPPQTSELEFYVYAGTCGGALYLDGEWLAWLPGVTRL